MSYYDTLDEDLQRAKAILQEGRLKDEEVPQQSAETRQRLIAQSGTIYGKDTYAAYKLLESFVAEIERLRALLTCHCGSVEWECMHCANATSLEDSQ